MSKHLFGTDGIRGVPGEFPLDNATLEAVGGALGAHLSAGGGAERPRVLLGMDTRESSGHIAARLARGAMDAGAEVAFAGVISTPVVACLVREDHLRLIPVTLGYDDGVHVQVIGDIHESDVVALSVGQAAQDGASVQPVSVPPTSR